MRENEKDRATERSQYDFSIMDLAEIEFAWNLLLLFGLSLLLLLYFVLVVMRCGVICTVSMHKYISPANEDQLMARFSSLAIQFKSVCGIRRAF